MHVQRCEEDALFKLNLVPPAYSLLSLQDKHQTFLIGSQTLAYNLQKKKTYNGSSKASKTQSPWGKFEVLGTIVVLFFIGKTICISSVEIVIQYQGFTITININFLSKDASKNFAGPIFLVCAVQGSIDNLLSSIINNDDSFSICFKLIPVTVPHTHTIANINHSSLFSHHVRNKLTLSYYSVWYLVQYYM